MNPESSTSPAPNLPKYIRKLRDVRLSDLPLVGGKNASLGEMLGELGSKGIPASDGKTTAAILAMEKRMTKERG
jgi:hypothetical protein